MPPATREICKQALEIYYHTTQSLQGHRFRSEQIDFWNGLTAKIFFHSASVLLLSEGTKLTDLPFDVNFSDSASVVVLARATVEAYATLHYLFLDTTADQDEREFRFAYDQMRGLLVRQVVDTPDVTAQRQQERALIDQLFQTIERTRAFQNIQRTNPARVNQIRQGRYQHLRNTEMIIRSGFGGRNARFFYGYLSDYTHSGYLSLLQVGQLDTATRQRDNMEIALLMIAITLALAVRGLAANFPACQSVLDAQPISSAVVNTLCAMATNDTLFG